MTGVIDNINGGLKLERKSARLWGFAALAALALHIGGGALVLEYMRPYEYDPEFGAPAIEIGVELSAKRDDPTDLPPGPDSNESAASAAIPEQRKVVERNDLPKDVPVNTEDPERQVALAETKEREKDEKAKPEITTAASAPSAASEATAMPSSQLIAESSRSVAPVQGSGESPQRVRAAWQKELIAHLDRHKRYPAGQSLDGIEILVSLVINDEGHVLSASIARGSGHPAFDQAALEMIRRSDPVPRPPAFVVREGLSFNLPVIFRAKQASR
jgi:TonB family protein